MSGFRFAGKCLTFVQPWASAIAFAGKDVENRSKRTHYRGPIAIHAGGKLDVEKLYELHRIVRGGERRPLIEWINRARRRRGLDAQDEPETGHVVAVAMLVGCAETSRSVWWDRKQWAWEIAGVVPIEPIPWKGQRVMWDCRFRYTPL